MDVVMVIVEGHIDDVSQLRVEKCIGVGFLEREVMEWDRMERGFLS